MRGWLSFTAAFLFVSATLSISARAEETTSCRAVCRDHAERVKRLFTALDLESEELAKVKSAVEKKDWPAACDALVAFYREGRSGAWLRIEPVERGTQRHLPADPILDDTFTIQRLTAKQPRLSTGQLNWGYNGPQNDREWGWLLNRHSYFSTLLHAWQKTGNPIYSLCFDRLVRDWVASNPPPGRDVSSAQWRVLEVGLRLNAAWPRAFYGFQQSDEFTAASRILMLSSIPDHADHCMRFHAGGGNHVLMEMYGLANAAACWPQFKDADKWFEYATRRMLPEIGRQVYPDGVQKELTSHYHRVSLTSFEHFSALAQRAGRELPASYLRGVELMWNYLAFSIRPDGSGVLNNDSDRNNNRAQLFRAAERYKRADWKWVATNGQDGKRPAGLPSAVFPWAGHVIMRNGWDPDAHWAFFDVGPAGIGHRHRDRLHLSISAYGRDLLVDGGRYWYKNDEWRRYFIGTQAHNSILIDGISQDYGPSAVDEPMTGNYAVLPGLDYARGCFDGPYLQLVGKAVHTRAVVYLRDVGWVVVDRVESDRPRRIEALWHFHPDCNVAVQGLSAATTDKGKGNLRIAPVGDVRWKLQLVKGQTEPDIQGWYSPEYNVKQPNPTAVYQAQIDDNTTFAWILIPSMGPVPEFQAESLPVPEGSTRMRFTLADGSTTEVAVRLTGKSPIPLSAGLKLEGDCGVLRPGKDPLVVGGRITDSHRHVQAAHQYDR